MFVTRNEGRLNELDEIDPWNEEVLDDMHSDRGVLELARRTALSGFRRFFGMKKVDKECQGNEYGEDRDIRYPQVFPVHFLWPLYSNTEPENQWRSEVF